jgi:hypothetical protein
MMLEPYLKFARPVTVPFSVVFIFLTVLSPELSPVPLPLLASGWIV